MMLVRSCFLCALITSALATFPGKYTLDAAWPADLAKIGVSQRSPGVLRVGLSFFERARCLAAVRATVCVLRSVSLAHTRSVRVGVLHGSR